MISLCNFSHSRQRSRNSLGYAARGANALAHMPRALSSSKLNRDKNSRGFGRLGSEFQDRRAVLRDERRRRGLEAAMVGEQKHLCRSPEFSQKAERRRAAVVVEMDQQIVGDERQRLGGFGVMLDAGDAEGEIELIANAVAHQLDGNLFAAVASAN